MLIDRQWQGEQRKLLIQANRNGFFYVLDRTNGKVLLAKPVIQNMNWSKELGPDHKPVLLPLPSGPSAHSVKVCPAQDGATNWFSPSYNPGSGYYVIQTFEKCSIYTTRQTEEWKAGSGYSGGSQRSDPKRARRKSYGPLTSKRAKWPGSCRKSAERIPGAASMGLASCVLFFGADGGMFSAVDGKTGKPLWNFHTNAQFKASRMTYEFDQKQYVAITAGQSILAFALPE